MKKQRISIWIVVLIVFINIFSVQNSFAEDHKVQQQDINVFINNDGSAKIREKRKAYLSEGTENYIVIGNLGSSKIKDFKVEEDGKVYDYIDDWDIDASRSEKKFKNGIIETGDGYELSWGIGEYGSHAYTLEYTITDFIKELEDGQVLFWRFINDELNTPPEDVRVTIESEKAFTQGEEEIYSFGYIGDINFRDGKIIAQSSQALTSGNYLTVLVGFPQGMFSTNDYIDKSFEEIKNQAFAGSDYGSSDDLENKEGSKSLFGKISGFFGGLISLLVPLVILVSIFGKNDSNIKPGKFKRKYKEEYYRDYPYEGDMLDSYYILYKIGVGNFENLLTSFILKWIKEDRIITEIDEKGFIMKKERTNIRFLNKEIDKKTLEGQLFSMMIDAAGTNEILEEKEFTKWASKHYSKIESWEERVKNNSSKKLQELGYLKIEEKNILFFKTHKIVLTEKGEELEERIYKYINYLYDFSLLNENEAINVKIWDNIMIWAALLGLTAVVSKQFEKLYPRYQAETVYRGNSVYLAHSLTRNVSKAASSSARSSGGGGSSSLGGGGGSFGGGSGGGTR